MKSSILPLINDNAVDTLIKALSDHVNDDIADADNDDITEADIDTVFNILIWTEIQIIRQT